jgi:Uma2 family endonuclease
MNVAEVREVLRRMSPPFLIRKYDATPEEYEAITDEDVRCEYFDGVLVMHSPATFQHERVSSFLSFLLTGYLAQQRIGEVLGANAVMQIGERRFCPDLSVLRLEHYDRVQFGRVMGPMDFVVEFLSKSTRDYDLREKRAAYRDGGVPEIWLIDADMREFRVDWREAGTGHDYRTELLTSGRWSSRVLPGFWLDVAWFWTDPPPNALECFQKIIGAAQS